MLAGPVQHLLKGDYSEYNAVQRLINGINLINAATRTAPGDIPDLYLTEWHIGFFFSK